MSYNVNEKGYYGEFGGAYIPEMLHPNVEELRQQYLKITAESEFQEEFNALLKDYAVVPHLFILQPVYPNSTTPKFISREKICAIPEHTKSTIPLGKYCWPNVWAKPESLPKPAQGNTVLQPLRFAP